MTDPEIDPDIALIVGSMWFMMIVADLSKEVSAAAGLQMRALATMAIRGMKLAETGGEAQGRAAALERAHWPPPGFMISQEAWVTSARRLGVLAARASRTNFETVDEEEVSAICNSIVATLQVQAH